MRPALSQLVLVVLIASLAWPGSAWQGNDQAPTPPSGAPAGESSSKPIGQPSAAKAPAAKPPATKPDTGTYDPVTAEDDIEVGTFYMHKGDIDAAIERFKDAIRARSNFAKPRLLIAEAYEKKNDKTNAVKYYKEYLQVFPKAPDAKKIQGRIERLSSE